MLLYFLLTFPTFIFSYQTNKEIAKSLVNQYRDAIYNRDQMKLYEVLHPEFQLNQCNRKKFAISREKLFDNLRSLPTVDVHLNEVFIGDARQEEGFLKIIATANGARITIHAIVDYNGFWYIIKENDFDCRDGVLSTPLIDYDKIALLTAQNLLSRLFYASRIRGRAELFQAIMEPYTIDWCNYYKTKSQVLDVNQLVQFGSEEYDSREADFTVVIKSAKFAESSRILIIEAEGGAINSTFYARPFSKGHYRLASETKHRCYGYEPGMQYNILQYAKLQNY
ncbi:unnamed protein product [Caenorhabditis angaria]|uniref:Uncharacterized protein n=1 Tax=Caenorhabditis angaria TaxID=860376 RepID=A0A9P1IXX8_9PELO|nr:unnamed protein product [Caenorhabditis angaria]